MHNTSHLSLLLTFIPHLIYNGAQCDMAIIFQSIYTSEENEELICEGEIWGIVNTLKPRQHGCHFTDDTFKRIFLNENVRILVKLSLVFVHKGTINNIQVLVQIMAWHWPGHKPLSEPMMVSLLTYICVTGPQ